MSNTEPLSKRRQALEKRKSQIDAQLSDLKAREKTQARKDETRRKIIIGGLVMAQMEKDADFKATMNALIERGVTRAVDRRVLGLPKKTS